jgi:hypothetical protein
MRCDSALPATYAVPSSLLLSLSELELLDDESSLAGFAFADLRSGRHKIINFKKDGD